MIYINENLYRDMFHCINEKHLLGGRKLQGEAYKKAKKVVNAIKSKKGIPEKEEAIIELLTEIFIYNDVNIESLINLGL